LGLSAWGGGVSERHVFVSQGTPPADTPVSVGVGSQRRKVFLLARDARWERALDHDAERGDVSLAHPSKELQLLFVEEADRGTDTGDRQQPSGRRLVRRPDDPTFDGAAVELHRHHRTDAGVRVVGEQVRERPVELETRDGDADVDGARQDGGGDRRNVRRG
jgi:hypothetical protein